MPLSAQQNLVPNPSFEEFDTCPQDISQPIPGLYELNHALGWVTPTAATSDYFNACNSTNVSVPYNFTGFQQARSGLGYAGIVMEYNQIGNDWFEYIQSKLNEPLSQGKFYHIEFYVSLAEQFSDYATSSIGAYISNDGIYSPSSTESNISFQPQIIGDSFFTDTSGWMLIDGYYLATGGEEFLTIGFYSQLGNIDTMSFKPNPPIESYGIYYLIDDVSIQKTEVLIPNVFTPNEDGMNDVFELSFPYESLTILNRWGNVVFSSQDGTATWNGETSIGNFCAEGVYFYIIEWLGTKFTGFVHLLR